MTRGNIGKRTWIRLVVSASGVALVLVFFLAPIIPIDTALRCHVQPPTYLYYTEWQSPSYYLFEVGYHYTPPSHVCDL